MLATKSNVLQTVLLRRLTLCWTESTMSTIISELAQKSSGLATRQEGVVRYDHVDAVRRISQFTANLTWTPQVRGG
jgi:hypothetical protein